MGEITYAPNDETWFKVSRRFVNSSRWFTSTLEATKLMVLLLEKASTPTNAFPGKVFLVGPALVALSGMTKEQVDKGISDLLGPDANSQGQRNGGAFIEALTREGSVVGYEILNFADFNPEVMERSAEAKKKRLRDRAQKAANARWSKDKEDDDF